MKKTLASLAIGALFASGSTIAQTPSKPDGVWRGSLGAGFSSVSGNTEASAFNGAADAVRQTNVDKVNLYAQGLYGKAQVDGSDKLTGKVIRLGGRYQRDLTDRVFGFGGLDFEKDRLAETRQRWLPQAGAGFHVIKSEALTFDVFAGMAYNRTERYAPFPDSKGAEALIGEESIHKLSTSTSFRQRAVLYRGVSGDRENDNRLTFDAGLVVAIGGGWNLSVNGGYRRDEDPAPGRKKSDTLIFTGLQYAFGPR